MFALDEYRSTGSERDHRLARSNVVIDIGFRAQVLDALDFAGPAFSRAANAQVLGPDSDRGRAKFYSVHTLEQVHLGGADEPRDEHGAWGGCR